MARGRNPNAMILPAAVILVLLTVVPLVRLVGLALTSQSLTVPGDSRVVWWRNVVEVLSSGTWWLAVALTLVVVTVAVMAQLALAAAFVGTIRRIPFGGPWLQILLLVPAAVVPSAAALAWRDGWTSGFGPAWFHYAPGSSQVAGLLTILSHEVWRGTGITAIILLAGLAPVKATLVDSAVADGATAWQRLSRVVLPAAGPAIGAAVLYRSLDALRAIEAPVLAAPSLGQLSTASQLVWSTSFDAFELGLGAAMSLVLLFLATALVLVLAVLLRVGRTT